ncbi:MAG: hypothetical protein ACJ76I_14865 [Gaiellaceae bacterium]
MTVIAGGALVAATGAGEARSSGAGQIYFYANINEPVLGGAIKNPLVVRPSTLALHEDGSWVVKDLHWTAWGSSVARATGVSTASNCMPNCSAGTLTTSPAEVALSSPGLVQGHEVYRCLRLTFRSHPASNQRRCLGRQGSLIGYVNVASTTTVHLRYFRSPSGNLACGVGDEERVYCSSQNRPHTVSLELDGTISVCNGVKCLGPAGAGAGAGAGTGPAPPVLGYGQVDTMGPYRCRSRPEGVTCTVMRLGKGFGKGFLINAASVTKVGR